VEREFWIVDVNTVFGFWPRRKAEISLGKLLSVLEEKHVSRAFTVMTEGVFYDFVAGNSKTLSACNDHARLLPVATLNPCRWFNVLEEGRRMLGAGVRLFRFFPQYQEWHISEAPFRRLVDEVLAPSPAILMLPAEMGVTAIGDLARSIDNDIIIDGCRYDKLAELIVVMDEVRNVYVETHKINSPDFIDVIHSEVGIERLIFGSYSPLAYTGAALSPILHADLDHEAKGLVLGGNLERLLDGSL